MSPRQYAIAKFKSPLLLNMYFVFAICKVLAFSLASIKMAMIHIIK